MTLLKIATSARLASYVETQRGVVYLNQTDFTDVAAVVMSVEDANAGILSMLHDLGFAIPAFIAVTAEQTVSADYLPLIKGVITLGEANKAFYNAQVEAAASEYQKNLLPPFFSTLKKYVEMNNSTFACPGHQGGEFFRKHPAGRQFFEFYGETIFRSDMCNADVKLGDLLIHEGRQKMHRNMLLRYSMPIKPILS